MVLIDEDYYPEYAPFFSLTETYSAKDNIFIRALRYLPKKIVRSMTIYMINKDSNIIRSKFGLSTNSLRNLNSFVILESFIGLHYSTLLPPFMEHVGLLQNERFNSPLDPEIKDWIDNSKGFIYIASGSMHKPSKEQEETLLNVFSSSNYDFLVTSKTLKCDLKNVKIVEWINQLETLQNKNILAFITHGGHASILEAIKNMVPSLCIPLDGDQFPNCFALRENKLGIYIKQEYLTAEVIKNALNELITDKEFKIQLQKFRAIEKNYKGKERAAEIILDIAKTRVDHLLPRWKYLPWYQQNDLDVFIVYFIIVYLLYLIIKKLCMRRNK